MNTTADCHQKATDHQNPIQPGQTTVEEIKKTELIVVKWS